MMKRLFLTALSSMLAAIVMMAAPVSREEAQQKAADFLKSQSKRPAGKMRMAARQQRLTPANGEEHAYWYAFNVGDNQGFVIVSGDDRTDAILGYSDSGSIDEANMPDNLRAWLQGYADEIKYIDEHHLDAAAVRGSGVPRRAPVLVEVAPMMQTMWDQDAPYWWQVPYAEVTYTNGETGLLNCYTGCAATAMAQVMYYQYAKTGIESNAYSPIPEYDPDGTYEYIDPYDESNTLVSKLPELPTTTFEWSKMQLVYGVGDPSNPTEAENAVAKLMRYCGQSIEMGYTPSGSGAISSKVATALKNYFGYDDGVCFVQRNDYGYTDWVYLIYEELTTNGPVYYSGQSMGGGHAFIVDGYQTEDYFHVNWGWSGLSNGFFKLSVLYSDVQGAGGSTSNDGYNRAQQAMINVKPTSDGVDNSGSVVMTTQGIDVVGAANTTRTSVDEQFNPFSVSAVFWNFTGHPYTFDIGYGLFNGEKLVEVDGKECVYSVETEALEPNTGYNNYSGTIALPANLPNGEYLLCPISRLSGSSIWSKDKGANTHFLVVSVKGLTLEVFSGSSNLSGTMTAPASITVGEDYTADFSLTNIGYTYSGDIQLILVADNVNYRVAAKQVEVRRGETKDYTISFSINSKKYVGTRTLRLWDKNNKLLASQDITITASNASSNVDLGCTAIIENQNSTGDKFLGNSIKVKATFINNTDEDYSGQYGYNWWRYYGNNYTYYINTVSAGNLYVPANSQKVVTLEVTNLGDYDAHRVLLYYVKNNTWTEVFKSNKISSADKVLAIYQPDGTITYAEATETFAVPATATSVDFTGSGVATVTPNDNPNTLYFFGANETAAGLDGKNVVKNGVAEQITITDGQNFAAPMAFTATNISYSRKETTLAADGTNGWSTIVLPFEATTVTADGEPIDWFHRSTDTGKNFWLKAFVTDNEDNVYFDFAERLEANTPYIIALPGAKWGANWNLMNKEIKFSAQNAIVQATEWTQVNGGSYKFVGTMKTDAVQDVYALNTAGNLFQHAEAAAMTPFRAYFAANKWLAPYRELHVASVVNIDPSGGVATGLPADPIAVQTEQSSAAEVYDLQGRRVTQPAQKGVYIVNGRKRVVK